MEEGSDTSKNFCIGVLAKFRVILVGLSQKLIIKRMAQPFAMQFCELRAT